MHWDVDIPELSEFVYFEKDTTQIKLFNDSLNPNDLPSGVHNFRVNVKDTSGMIGDPTGNMSKILKIIVVNEEKRTSSALGLELLTTMDSPEITELAKDPTKITTDAEKAMVDIINNLGIREDNLNAFTENLKKGSIAVVQNDEVIQSPIMIESRLEEGVLFDAEVDSVSNDLLEETSKLISDGQRNCCTSW